MVERVPDKNEAVGPIPTAPTESNSVSTECRRGDRVRLDTSRYIYLFKTRQVRLGAFGLKVFEDVMGF